MLGYAEIVPILFYLIFYQDKEASCKVWLIKQNSAQCFLILDFRKFFEISTRLFFQRYWFNKKKDCLRAVLACTYFANIPAKRIFQQNHFSLFIESPAGGLVSSKKMSTNFPIFTFEDPDPQRSWIRIQYGQQHWFKIETLTSNTEFFPDVIC